MKETWLHRMILGTQICSTMFRISRQAVERERLLRFGTARIFVDYCFSVAISSQRIHVAHSTTMNAS